MAISKWNPFGGNSNEELQRSRRRSNEPFRSLQRDMNRLFEDFFGGSALQPRTSFASTPAKTRFRPRIDISEDNESLNITAELPGMNKDDIELEADENSVTIKGEKSVEHEEKDEDYYHSERSYGYFRRTIPFPVEVDTGKAKATFRDGVLDVRFPKMGESKGKKLEIE